MTSGKFKLKQGDCLELLRSMPDNYVDLVFCSPPYEQARTYGVDFKLKGQEFVDWALARYVECVRVSKGLVAWVIEGQTRQFRWTSTPALLMADLHRAGVKLRKPPIFHRVGIPGSGGPDWLRNDYEFIICASKGKLPWSDNTACGHPPKYAEGGMPSHRVSDGSRVNVLDAKSGHVLVSSRTSGRLVSHRDKNGYSPRIYQNPERANPGNVIKCTVGGGRMGSTLAHENEAPFPESLAEFFVKSFCPPGGIVLDPFMGSGTSLAVALKNGRNAIGFDIRESQLELTARRLATIQPTKENT